MTLHYHVQRFRDDEGIVTRTRVEALNYAATELARATDAAHEWVTLHGEDQEYEDAYNAFTNSESWGALAHNLLNIIRQADANPSKRAPLYRDEPQCGPRWTIAADHATMEANNNGPDGFALWSCERDECEPGAWVVETDGQQEGDTFTRDEFENAWFLYTDVLNTWANNSDDAYDEGAKPDANDPDDWGTDGATVAGYLADTKREIDYMRDHSFVLHANNGSTVTFTLRWDTESDPNQ